MWYFKTERSDRKRYYKSGSNLLPVYQSKAIRIGRTTYTLFGATVDPSTNFFNEYVVIGDDGHHAPEEISNKVHRTIAHLRNMDVLKQLLKSWKFQSEKSNPYDELVITNELLEASKKCQVISENVSKVKVISESLATEVYDSWKTFWRLYRPRMSIILKHDLNQPYDFSQEGILWVQVFHTELKNIVWLMKPFTHIRKVKSTDLIFLMELHAKESHISKKPLEKKSLKKFDWLRILICRLGKRMIWFYTPFFLLLFYVEGITIETLAFPATCYFVYYPIVKSLEERAQKKVSAKKIEAFVEEVKRVVDTNIENNSISYEEREELEVVYPERLDFKTYQVKGTSTMLMQICVFIGMLSLVTGGTRWLLAGWNDVNTVEVYIGSGLMVFALIAIYLPISKRKMTLNSEYLKIGMVKQYGYIIDAIFLNRSSKCFDVNVIEGQTAISFYVHEKDLIEAEKQMKLWCKVMNISFVVKD